MITEQDKQAILNGALAENRKGCKCKIVFHSECNSDKYPYCAVYFENNKWESCWLTEDFGYFFGEFEEHNLDIIGLWQDKPEPFNLERALAGEKICYFGEPCYVYQSRANGNFLVEPSNNSFLNKYVSLGELSKVTMWKDPLAK